MSAYLMSEDETLTLAMAVKALRYGAHEFAAASVTELATAMFRLNAESVRALYGERAAETFIAIHLPTEIAPAAMPAAKLIEGLECWLYQSCEGSCNESPLYKALETVCGRVARRLLHQLDENNRFGTPVAA